MILLLLCLPVRFFHFCQSQVTSVCSFCGGFYFWVGERKLIQFSLAFSVTMLQYGMHAHNFSLCFFRCDAIQPPKTFKYSYLHNMVILSITIVINTYRYYSLFWIFMFPLLPFHQCRCLKLLFHYFHYFKEKINHYKKTENVEISSHFIFFQDFVHFRKKKKFNE